MTLLQAGLETWKRSAVNNPPFRVFLRVHRATWPTNQGEIIVPASVMGVQKPWHWHFTQLGGSGVVDELSWIEQSNYLRRVLRLPMIEVAG